VVELLRNPLKNVEVTNEVAEPSLTDRQRGREYAATYKFGAGYNRHNFIDPLTHVFSPGNYLLYGQAAQAVCPSNALARTGIVDST
jgi:hypothetical protein